MSKTMVVAPPPYTAPYAADRAWEIEDWADAWWVDAMRNGYTEALEVAIKMDENKIPEMAQPVGVEKVLFRSSGRARNNETVVQIDSNIVDYVMDVSTEWLEQYEIRVRREHQDELNEYPRLVLDAFQQDIVDAVEEAGQYDRATALRWKNAWVEMESLAARWLDRDWPIYNEVAE